MGDVKCVVEKHKTKILKFLKDVHRRAKVSAQKPVKLKTTYEIVVLLREIVYS